jgi:hypothetical protein
VAGALTFPIVCPRSGFLRIITTDIEKELRKSTKIRFQQFDRRSSTLSSDIFDDNKRVEILVQKKSSLTLGHNLLIFYA